jgi:hypothetical protein
MHGEHRSQWKSGFDPGDVDDRACGALTDLSAYALTLEAERHRLDDRVLELAEIDSSLEDRRGLLRERAEIAEELSALRGTIAALQEQVWQRA